MIKAIIFDFARTLLFPTDKAYSGRLNDLFLEKSVKEGDKFKFNDNFMLNQELLNFLHSLKSKYKLYMYTTGTIQDLPEVKSKLDLVFDRVYTVIDTNTDKSNPNSYGEIATQLGLAPNELLFVDSNQENVTAATRAGVQAVLYTTNGEIQQKLRSVV